MSFQGSLCIFQIKFGEKNRWKSQGKLENIESVIEYQRVRAASVTWVPSWKSVCESRDRGR